jgi:hypothetical protein
MSEKNNNIEYSFHCTECENKQETTNENQQICSYERSVEETVEETVEDETIYSCCICPREYQDYGTHKCCLKNCNSH